MSKFSIPLPSFLHRRHKRTHPYEPREEPKQLHVIMITSGFAWCFLWQSNIFITVYGVCMFLLYYNNFMYIAPFKTMLQSTSQDNTQKIQM